MKYEDIVGHSLEPNPDYEYLFLMPSGKYNDTVKLTDEDKKSVKILCKEPYAQEYYNKYVSSDRCNIACKDLMLNQIYDVRPVSINNQDKLIHCIEVESGSSVFVPVSDVKNKNELTTGTILKVLLQKNDNGFNFASMKKADKVICFKTLQQYLENGTDFDVVVKELVRGGFIASFENTIDCFIPGAHAAANIIYDFESYLGKTIHVVVDNYDSASNMFIVSHKKYIKKILPERVKDINFGTKYKGVLTSDPTKFGIFVEFAINPKYGPIYTGLIHVSELVDKYANLKQGDEVEFYVSRVLYDREKKNFKINLTFDASKIDEENVFWQDMKDNKEGKEFNFMIEDKKLIISDGVEDGFSISVSAYGFENEALGKTKVVLSYVDHINKQVGLNFL